MLCCAQETVERVGASFWLRFCKYFCGSFGECVLKKDSLHWELGLLSRSNQRLTETVCTLFFFHCKETLCYHLGSPAIGSCFLPLNRLNTKCTCKHLQMLKETAYTSFWTAKVSSQIVWLNVFYSDISTQPDGFLGQSCACSRAQGVMSSQPVAMMSPGIPIKPVDWPLSWVFNEWWSSPIGWLCSVIWKRSIVHNNNMYCPWFYSRGGKQARFKHDKFFSVSLLFLFWKTWENGNSFFFSLLLLLLFLVLLLLWSFCHLPILSWFINADSRIHIDSQRHIFQNMSSPH